MREDSVRWADWCGSPQLSFRLACQYTPQELALLLAIETDSYWSLGAQENVFGITEVGHDLYTVAAYAAGRVM